MKLESIADSRTGDRYDHIVHPTGLHIYLYPKENSSTTFAVFGTKYGSIDNRFRLGEGAPQTVPEGIAHFLEHKLFESEDGDAFERFAQTGASANAFTSFESTCYVFSCSDRLYESLEILLDFVQSPYFTPETVQKEQGIIGQEIRMYEDDPNWRVMFNYLRAMYHQHPIRLDIAGTVESIARITADHLYSCYNAFYDLHNMALAVAGNFDADQVLALCDKMLKPGEARQVRRDFLPEPADVRAHLTREPMPVVLPLFQFGYKEAVTDDFRTEKDLAAMEVLLEALASDASPLYEDLMNRGLVNESSFGYEYFEGAGFATVMFSGESHDPLAVAGAIRAEVQRFKREGVPVEAFENAKRSIYGENIMALNSPANIANALISFSFKDRRLFDYIGALAELTLADVEERLRALEDDKTVLSVIDPMENG